MEIKLNPESDLATWRARARPGDRVVYHVGLLIDDCDTGPDCEKLRATRAAAWELYEAGQVHLVQRRNGAGCDYLLIAK